METIINNRSVLPRLVVLCYAVSLLLSACRVSSTPTSENIPFDTLVAQTVSAYNTQQARKTDSVLPTPTLYPPSPTFTPTATPVQTAIPHSCDRGLFIKHVTYDPFEMVKGGVSFIKQWEVQNTGRCTWTTGYALEFVSGEKFGAPLLIPLEQIVRPDEIIDLSIHLTAPVDEGIYTGKWALVNDDGNQVPMENLPENNLVITVVVKDLDEVVLDFTMEYCEANWETWAEDDLPCPGSKTDVNQGYVFLEEDGILENGDEAFGEILVTRPDHNPNDGFIEGFFPAIDIERGDHFAVTIGCAPGATACDLIFDLQYQFVGGSIKTLASWREVYDEQVREISLDLSSLIGEPVRLILRVRNNGTSEENEGYWYNPLILR